ncbi:hypothetical protein [Spirosoma jeollabukense]
MKASAVTIVSRPLYKIATATRLPIPKRVYLLFLITNLLKIHGSGHYTSMHWRDTPKPTLGRQMITHFATSCPIYSQVSKSALINPTPIDKVINEYTKSISSLLADSVIGRVAHRRLANPLIPLVIPS